jgi:8-oxo-dGTP pyrophosphatase MutT (NUDIX family)
VTARWSALAAAAAGPDRPRRPWCIDGVEVGSVAEHHLPALAPFDEFVHVAADHVALTAPAPRRDDVLARINGALRQAGHIRAWRDEVYPITSLDGRQVLGTLERAAARFWGTLTFGAHANGFVPGPDGRPARLWIARRSRHKATDPGRLDNLVGGGVPHGQTPAEALVREGWEEAGLTPVQMARARPGQRLVLSRMLPEGYQLEWLSSFDVPLAEDERPVNQDGEVESFECVSLGEAAAMAAGEDMTVDAALVTLDFLLRHRLLAPEDHATLAPRMAALTLPG